MTQTTNQTPVQYYSVFPTYFAMSQLHSVRNTCTSTLLLWFTPAFFDSTFHSSFDYFDQLFAHTSPGKWLFVVNKGWFTDGFSVLKKCAASRVPPTCSLPEIRDIDIDQISSALNFKNGGPRLQRIVWDKILKKIQISCILGKLACFA